MRVRVDQQKCQGHTLCNRVAPDLFLLRDDDGHAYVESEDVPEEFRAVALRAQAACPEEAIRVEDA